MGTRHPNHRLVRIHLTYTVQEVATLFSVHKNTVRNWLEQGLDSIDDKRPLLVLGEILVAFLKNRRQRNRCPTKAGEIYCLRCRQSREPAGQAVVYRPLTADRGDLIGICSACSCRLVRRVSMAKLDSVRGDLTVSLPEAQEHIGVCSQPSVNCDFKQDNSDHGQIQRE